MYAALFQSVEMFNFFEIKQVKTHEIGVRMPHYFQNKNFTLSPH